jgi:hypothetical protein
MYENRKMRPVETVPGKGGGEIKEKDGVVNATVIYHRNFAKCHHVPPER